MLTLLNVSQLVLLHITGPESSLFRGDISEGDATLKLVVARHGHLHYFTLLTFTINFSVPKTKQGNPRVIQKCTQDF